MNFTHLIGNTPMLRLRYRLDGREGCVYAKLEAYNLTGSIKDRMAAYILTEAVGDGTLKPGQPIVEMTSGNTGISFAALGALAGHPVHIFMPDWASDERKRLMAMYGARLHTVSREEGGFAAALRGARALAEALGAFQPRQFENQENPRAHFLTTGAEILRQLPEVTDLVAGVGSGGTLMGTARRLKEDHPVRAVAVEPDAVPLLSGGRVNGPHRIEGIGDDFIPAIVDRALIDSVIGINDLDAVAMAAKLGRVLGLGVGISSGANLLAAVLQNIEPGRRVVTVFPDDSKKYLSTLLASPPAESETMWTSRIELLDLDAAA